MASVSDKRMKNSRITTGIFAILFAFIALSSWGFSSAVGSSPDDNFHLASLWCGGGDKEGICEAQSGSASKLVPQQIYEAANCFAYKAEQSAACQTIENNVSTGPMSLAEHANTINLYPPLFYAVNSTFVSSDPVWSVLSIRLFNSALAVSLLAVLYLLLPSNIKHLPLWALATISVPLLMFIVPSTNPSSWAAISAGVLFYALLGFFKTSGGQKIGLGLLSIIAALVGAGARGDSGLYASLTAVLAVFISFERSRKFLVSVLLPLAVIAIGAFFYFSTSQSSLAAAGLEGAADPTLTTLDLLVQNTLRMPLLWLGIFGSWGLGWLDTILPQYVWIGSLGGFITFSILGMNRMTRRTIISAAIVLVALLLIPLYVMVKSHALVGTLVQPRYLLPLFILFSGILVYRRVGHISLKHNWVAWAGIALLSVANALALHRNIRRYTSGVDATGWNLDNNVEWWWSLPISPMGVWVLGALSFVAFLVLLKILSPRFQWGVGAKAI